MHPGNTCNGPFTTGAAGAGCTMIVVEGLLQNPVADALIVYVPGVEKLQLKLVPEGEHDAAGDTFHVVPGAVEVNVTG